MKKYLLAIITLLLVLPKFCLASLNTHSIDLELDSSQYLSITDASQTGLDLTGDLTMEAWIKLESDKNDLHTIISKWVAGQKSYTLYFLDSSNQLIFDYSADGATASEHLSSVISIPTGEWHHIAITFDASAHATTFYLDGTAINTDTGGAITSIFNGIAPFFIGQVLSVRYFDGLIDEVRIWNDIRTSEEISANYQTELVGNEANLVAYWQLDNSLLDETVNNNDLTNNNSAVFSTTVPFAGSEAGGPCSYSGTGDWYVYYSDDCTITSDVYVNGACYFVKDAAGYFGLQADISCSGKKEVGYGFNIDKKYGSDITIRY